jgi:protease II
MQRIILSAFCLLCFLLSFGQEFPKVQKAPVTIQKHDISFVDDYPFLENATSSETLKWVEQQNAATDNHYAVVKKNILVSPKFKNTMIYQPIVCLIKMANITIPNIFATMTNLRLYTTGKH